jgi:hypothetical protein
VSDDPDDVTPARVMVCSLAAVAHITRRGWHEVGEDLYCREAVALLAEMCTLLLAGDESAAADQVVLLGRLDRMVNAR